VAVAFTGMGSMQSPGRRSAAGYCCTPGEGSAGAGFDVNPCCAFGATGDEETGAPVHAVSRATMYTTAKRRDMWKMVACVDHQTVAIGSGRTGRPARAGRPVEKRPPVVRSDLLSLLRMQATPVRSPAPWLDALAVHIHLDMDATEDRIPDWSPHSPTSDLGCGQARDSLVIRPRHLLDIDWTHRPAEGATTQVCANGTWNLVRKATSSTSTANGEKDWTKRSGATGVKLTIGKKYAVYSFTGSTREYSSGVMGGEEYAWSIIYKGSLRVKVEVNGATKGSIELNGKFARGDATSQSVSTKPLPRTDPVDSVVEDLKRGHAESMVPQIARFTCSEKKLVMRESYNMVGYKFTNILIFHRID
jgi:hypothetical protein